MLCPRLELTTEFHYQKYLLFLHAVWTARGISFDDELHVCMCLYTVCQYTLVRFPALRPCIWCRCLRLCAYKCDLEVFTVSATESTDKRQATITTTGGKLNLLLVHTKIIHTKRYYLDLYIPGIFNEIYVRTYIFIYFIWVSCHSIAKIRCAVFACECVCVCEFERTDAYAFAVAFGLKIFFFLHTLRLLADLLYSACVFHAPWVCNSLYL